MGTDSEHVLNLLYKSCNYDKLILKSTFYNYKHVVRV